MTEAEIGWLAGLLEGEGCITFLNKNGVAITIGMTDEDVIRRVHSLTGRGAVYIADGRTRAKPLFQWRVANKDDCTFILEIVLPWLGKRRRAKADEALIRLARNKGIGRIDHGTRSGYKKELYQGLDPCPECRKANSGYQKERSGA